jgi:hypothetical protein
VKAGGDAAKEGGAGESVGKGEEGESSFTSCTGRPRHLCCGSLGGVRHGGRCSAENEGRGLGVASLPDLKCRIVIRPETLLQRDE